MKCICIKSYNDGYVNFKINESYDYISVPASFKYPPVYSIFNGMHNHKNFTYSEFNEYFKRAA